MDSQHRKPSTVLVLLAVVLAVIFLIPAWLPAALRDQWQWILTVVQSIIAVAGLVYLVWFVRKQRDDYWREQGKDPKHPEL